jgi:hypothetical protein
MELSLAFFLWFRVTRPWVIFVGFLLHTGILVTINIPVFGELMWIGYLAFLTPPEFDAFLRAIDVRRLFRRSESLADEGFESESRSEPGHSTAGFPSFGPASIVVRLDAGSGLLGPHRIDVAPARSIEEASY